jgi:hypothetical protein
MKGSGSASAQALDELRKKDMAGDAGDAVGGVATFDPLSYYVGPFVRSFDKNSRSSRIDFTKYIDRDKKLVRSVTDELEWDYATGLASVNTPRSQGATGFLQKAGRIELGDVSIECGNEFASILVTSLDDQAIASSKKLLIQATTEDKLFGFSASNGRITNLGSGPWNVRRISAKVSVKFAGGGGDPKVFALDENGYDRGQGPEMSWRGGHTFDVSLAEDALYHVIQR